MSAINTDVTFEDVTAAIDAVAKDMYLGAADCTICAGETWANRGDGLYKAFKMALEDPSLNLGLSAEDVKRLDKLFRVELPQANKKRIREETQAEEAAQQAAQKAEEKAAQEKEAIKSIAEASRHHRDEIKRLYEEANETVEDLSDDGITAPRRIKDLIAEMKGLSDGVKVAWEDVRDAISKTLAEQKAKDLEASFNDATEKSRNILSWVSRHKSVDEVVKEVRESRKRTQNLLEAAISKAKSAQEAFAEADAIEEPRGLIAIFLRKSAPPHPLRLTLRAANQDLTNLLAEIRRADKDAGDALSRAEAALTASRGPSRKEVRAALQATKAAEEEAKTGEGKIEAAAAAVADAAAKWKEEVEKKPSLSWWPVAILGASLVVLFIEYMIISRSVSESWRWLPWIPFVLFGILGTGAFALKRGWTPKVTSAHVTFHVIACVIIVVLWSSAPGVDKLAPAEPTRSPAEAAETFESIFEPYPTHTPTLTETQEP